MIIHSKTYDTSEEALPDLQSEVQADTDHHASHLIKEGFRDAGKSWAEVASTVKSLFDHHHQQIKPKKPTMNQLRVPDEISSLVTQANAGIEWLISEGVMYPKERNDLIEQVKSFSLSHTNYEEALNSLIILLREQVQQHPVFAEASKYQHLLQQAQEKGDRYGLRKHRKTMEALQPRYKEALRAMLPSLLAYHELMIERKRLHLRLLEHFVYVFQREVEYLDKNLFEHEQTSKQYISMLLHSKRYCDEAKQHIKTLRGETLAKPLSPDVSIEQLMVYTGVS